MRITWLFAMALCAAGCGKKSSTPKGDCTASVDNAMKVSTDELKKSNVPDSAIPKIHDASIARCNADKWSNEVLKCFADAKTPDDIKKCQQMMTKEQRDGMAKALEAAMPSDTGSAPPPEQGSAGSADDTAGGSGSAAPAIAGLPAECADYKALMEKLAKCDKLPQASREMLQKTFDATSKAWANVDKLPDSAKAGLVMGCKQGVDALKKAAGATCGF
jgi:hypothetical protein